MDHTIALHQLTEDDVERHCEQLYAYFREAASQVLEALSQHHQQTEIANAALLGRTTLSNTVHGTAEWTVPKFAAICAIADRDPIEQLRRGRDAVLTKLAGQRSEELVLEAAKALSPVAQQRLIAALAETAQSRHKEAV